MFLKSEVSFFIYDDQDIIKEFFFLILTNTLLHNENEMIRHSWSHYSMFRNIYNQLFCIETLSVSIKNGPP